MAVPTAVVQEVKSILGSTVPINQKLQKVLAILEGHQFCHKQTLLPKQVLCHPVNRGGQMLSYFDVSKKGQDLTSIGIQKSLLHGAICTQMAKDPKKRASQVQSNAKLQQDSKGFLAPLTGEESALAYMFCQNVFLFQVVHEI